MVVSPSMTLMDEPRTPIAGLDLSLTGAGVAVLRPDGSLRTERFGHALKKEASERQRLERVITITNAVMGCLREELVTHVGVENYAFSGHLLTLQAELAGNLKVQIFVGLKTVPLVIPSTSVRKFLLGKNTKDKAVVEKHLRFLGYNSPRSHDEFDALAVAKVIEAWAFGRSALIEEHQQDLMRRLDYQVSRPEGMIKNAGSEHGRAHGRSGKHARRQDRSDG